MTDEGLVRALARAEHHDASGSCPGRSARLSRTLRGRATIYYAQIRADAHRCPIWQRGADTKRTHQKRHARPPRTASSHPPTRSRGNYLCAGYQAFFHHVDRPMRFMAEQLQRGLAPADVMQVYAEEDARRGRNEPCTCGSGRTWKHCHERHHEGDAR